MDEAAYQCQTCGEEIVIPIDSSAGRTQRYEEDCPVCCHTQILTLKIHRDGTITVTAEAE